MAKQTKKNKKDEITVHPIKSREMSSLHLSSDSEFYEQRNAREALNLEKCCCADAESAQVSNVVVRMFVFFMLLYNKTEETTHFRFCRVVLIFALGEKAKALPVAI